MPSKLPFLLRLVVTVISAVAPLTLRAQTIDAVPDTLSITTSAPPTAVNVLANDTGTGVTVLGLARTTALYEAGTGGTPPDPTSGAGGAWTFLDTEDGDAATGNITATPSASHNGSGLDAWVMRDQTGAGGQWTTYTRTLDAAAISAANTHGWCLEATIRFVDDYNAGDSCLLQFGNGSQRFLVFFDLDASDDLTAWLIGTGGGKITLTTGGTGADAFHDYALLYDPTTQTASFVVDGVRQDGGAWTGQSSDFSGVQWGTGSSGGQGTAAYHRVAHQVFSPTLTLDSGALVSQANGEVSFNPNGGYQTLTSAETAEEAISYVITDGSGLHDTGLLIVTVQGEDSPAGDTLRIFVLTGQSNSLGTLATTDATMLRDAPGIHPAEQGMAVPFFWDNRADGTAGGDAALGDSGGQWVNLAPQAGGYYANNDDHWGPEIGFARMLWNAGYRDFGIVKASRGGGGNSFWVKDAADDHMYEHLVATVNAALTTLPAGYTGSSIAGLLYVQGESNNATEADEADTRFDDLLSNLKTDLPNAATLAGVFGEIAGGSQAAVTRARQQILANSRSDIGYASNASTSLHDGLHYTADSQLLLGERMASEMINTGALGPRPLPAWSNLHAWFIADNSAQPNTSNTIDRWATLHDGSATRDLTRTVSGHPARLPVTSGSDQVRRIMSFDGSSDLWASSSEFGTLGAGRSIAFLGRLSTANDGFLFDGSTSSGRTRVQTRNGDWQAGISTSTWNAAGETTTALTAKQWQQHVFTFNENAGGTEIGHWIDGSRVATVTDPSQSGLSGSNGGSPFLPLDCEIAEIAVYDKALNAAEISDLAVAWSVRWGNITGPPFAAAVSQAPRSIPRYGLHNLLLVTVDNPVAGTTTLDNLGITLKPGTRDLIKGVSLLNGGTTPAFNSSAAVLDTASSPTADTINLTANRALPEGRSYFWITIEPERWAPLDSSIDARVDTISFSGAESGTVVPPDGDPAGMLTFALVPLSVDIRTRGAHGLGANYRIPGIACDDHGVLHAVYDNRYGFGGDLPGDIDVAYHRSTDGGVTWEPQQIILDFDASEPGSSGSGVGDPCILWDPATDTLWVAALWSFGNNGYNGSGAGTDPADTGQYVLTKSTDGGDSWSAPINITVDVKDDPNWRLVFQGPGHGLVMRDGTLVFPSQYRDATGRVRSCSVFSTDHGATWDFGSAVPDATLQTNEASVCELDDGRLLFTCRTPSGGGGLRAWAHYTPGGANPMRDGTWGTTELGVVNDLYQLATVPDPVVQGSVIQWKSTVDGHPREWLLFANPATGGRNGITLRISADGGITWPVSRLVYAGPSAYSSLCILPDNSIGLLYEKDNYKHITFVRIEEEWLLNPDADGDSDGLPDAWELLYGTNPAVDDANADPDGDGRSNAEERAAGTDPRNAASVLELTSVSGQASSLDITWTSVPGKTYQIQTSPDLVVWTPFDAPIIATGPSSDAAVPHGNPPRLFVRVGTIQ